MIAAGGLSGWCSWWLGPWVVFHGWLSVLSLVQHTGPHITWAEEVGAALADCIVMETWALQQFGVRYRNCTLGAQYLLHAGT